MTFLEHISDFDISRTYFDFFTNFEHFPTKFDFCRKLNFSLNSNFPTNFHCIFGRKIFHNIQNDLKTLESSTYQRFKPSPSMYRHSVCDAVNNISMLCLCKKHIDVGPDYLNHRIASFSYQMTCYVYNLWSAWFQLVWFVCD